VVHRDKYFEVLSDTNEIEYFIKVDYKNEGVLLDGDFKFHLTFDHKFHLKFWLNTNFIPSFILMKNKKDFSIAAENFDFTHMKYQQLSIFSDKFQENKQEVFQENKPMIFQQEELKIHRESAKYLKKVNESEKSKITERPIQILMAEEIDLYNKIKGEKIFKEDFCVNLIFSEN